MLRHAWTNEEQQEVIIQEQDETIFENKANAKADKGRSHLVSQ